MGKREGALRRAVGGFAVVVAAVGALLASAPAGAAVSSGPGSTVNAGRVTGQFTATGAGAATFSGHTTDGTGAAETSTITLGAPVTLLSFSSFNLESNDTLNFVFASRSDVVLIRVDSGVATIDGTLNATIGTVAGAVGGTVVFVSSGGVTFGQNAAVDAGGLLATTGQITGADLFDGDGSWSFDDIFAVAGVLVQAGAEVNVHGGFAGFIAPDVQTTATSTISDLSADTDSDVVYGAAMAFTLTHAADAEGDLNLAGLAIYPGAAPAGSYWVALAGATSAGNVFVASANGHHVSIDGSFSATGANASGDGRLVVSAGAGLAGVPLRPAPGASAVPTALLLPAQLLTASSSLIVANTGDLTIDAQTRLSAPSVALSTGGNYRNHAGAAAFANPFGNWTVYAPNRGNIVAGGLDSGQRALWGNTIATHPPSTGGNRYVFSYSPVLTFASLDVTKTFPEVVSAFPHAVDYTNLQPAQPGLFLGDTQADTHSGTPAFSSTGAPATARVVAGGHPIVIAKGTLTSPAGYSFAFASTGRLYVIDTTPPEITRSVLGTLGSNGWYTSDVVLSWAPFDAASDIVPATCPTYSITADQPAQTYTCAVQSAGGPSSDSVSIKRDATPPALSVAAVRNGAAYASGSWTNGDVSVSFTCADERSGGDATTVPASRSVTVTTSIVETCRDLAGLVSPPAQLQVNIDRDAPVVSNVRASTSAGPYGGAWTNRDVTVEWDCADTGGSGATAAGGSVTLTATGSVTPTCDDVAGNRTTAAAVQANIDKVTPTLRGVPAGVTVLTDGTTATATWALPTAEDEHPLAPAVSCTPSSGSSFPVGSTTVTCSATDEAGNTTAASFVVTVTSATVAFSTPIDAGAVNVVKAGRVVPVKMALTVGGVTIASPAPQPVYIGATRIACATGATSEEVGVYAAGGSSTGNLFRWDAAEGRWSYNLDTSALRMVAGSCYRVSVLYGGTIVNGNASGGSVAGSFVLRAR